MVGSVGVKAEVQRCGGIAALVALIAQRPVDDRAAEAAVGALANLAHNSPGDTFLCHNVYTLYLHCLEALFS